MKPMLTIHQKLSRGGYPLAQGSEVRMPDGTKLPGVKKITCEAVVGEDLWRVTIECDARFGEAIRAEDYQAEP